MIRSTASGKVLNGIKELSNLSVLNRVLAVTAVCRFPDWRQKMMQLVIMFLHILK